MTPRIMIRKTAFFLWSALIFLCLNSVCAQQTKITIDATQKGASVSPDLHGIFFEEISHGGEGGLYAELIQNRGF